MERKSARPWQRQPGPDGHPALNMPDSWACLIDGGTDDGCHSSSSSAGSMSFIELFASQTMLLVPAHVLHLISLVIKPSWGLGLQAPRFDPDPCVRSSRSVTLGALATLRSVYRISGPHTILRCLPGCSASAGDPAFIASLEAPSKTLHVTESEDNIVLKSLMSASNFWEMLSSRSRDSPKDPSPITPAGWDLLEIMVEAWELDSRDRLVSKPAENASEDSRSENSSYSRHLLRQFPLLSFGGRKVDSRVLEIVFEPFSSGETRSSGPWGFSIDTQDRARKLAMRLFGLLQDLDRHGLLDPGRLRQDAVAKMRALRAEEFHLFIKMLPCDHDQPNAELLLLYLEAMTHSPKQSLAKDPKDTPNKSNQSSSQILSLNSVSTNRSGLRRNVSQTLLTLDSPKRPSVKPSRDQFPTASHVLNQVFTRPLLGIPDPKKKDTSKHLLSLSQVVEVELGYLNVLNELLHLFEKVYEQRTRELEDWIKIVVSGELRNTLNVNRSLIEECYGKPGKRNDDVLDEETLLELKLCRKWFERTLADLETCSKSH